MQRHRPKNGLGETPAEANANRLFMGDTGVGGAESGNFLSHSMILPSERESWTTTEKTFEAVRRGPGDGDGRSWETGGGGGGGGGRGGGKLTGVQGRG